MIAWDFVPPLIVTNFKPVAVCCSECRLLRYYRWGRSRPSFIEFELDCSITSWRFAESNYLDCQWLNAIAVDAQLSHHSSTWLEYTSMKVFSTLNYFPATGQWQARWHLDRSREPPGANCCCRRALANPTQHIYQLCYWCSAKRRPSFLCERTCSSATGRDSSCSCFSYNAI